MVIKKRKSVNNFIEQGADISPSSRREREEEKMISLNVPISILRRMDQYVRSKPKYNRTFLIVQTLKDFLDREDAR